jgi:hypothetical protein
MVVVQVYDEDGKRQELISECELDISNVLIEGEEDSKSARSLLKHCIRCLFTRLFTILDWYPLTYKGRSAGEIYLELTFYAAVRLTVYRTNKIY